MSQSRTLKKPLLNALIVSVILGAILGIILVLRNTWGWFEVRVMLTTIIIAAASVCGLACDLSKTPLGVNWLPRTGLLLTAITAVMLLAGMWGEFESEGYWKSVTVISVFAVATVHVCLLSIARLPARHRWVYFIGCQVIYGLAALVASIIVFEIDSEAIWRIIAALAIVDAAITLVIPILHRVARLDTGRDKLLMPVDERNIASIDAQIADLRKRITQLERLRNEITAATDEQRDSSNK